MDSNIKPGQTYKHYKCDIYKILNLVKHSETEEWLVVYERQTDIIHQGWKIWARPLTMFQEVIEVKDYKGPRFSLIEN